jgi:hypothetical protein
MEMMSKTLLKIKKKEKLSECPKTAATKTNPKKTCNMRRREKGDDRNSGAASTNTHAHTRKWLNNFHESK